MRRLLLSTGWLAVVLGCGGGQPAGEPPEPEEFRAVKGVPLRADLFAGTEVAVLPIALVVPDSSLAGGELFQRRDVLLLWADSIIQAKLEERAPEVVWKFPPELRRLARRNPVVVPDPDRMGQAVMRSPSLDVVPDPFRSSLRAMVAVSGGRMALVPAALTFRQPEPGTVEAQLMAVMADARTGKVLWRSLAVGRGGSLDRALAFALDDILPVATLTE